VVAPIESDDETVRPVLHLAEVIVRESSSLASEGAAQP
jgi:predicted transcriptional regulator